MSIIRFDHETPLGTPHQKKKRKEKRKRKKRRTNGSNNSKGKHNGIDKSPVVHSVGCRLKTKTVVLESCVQLICGRFISFRRDVKNIKNFFLIHLIILFQRCKTDYFGRMLNQVENACSCKEKKQEDEAELETGDGCCLDFHAATVLIIGS